MTAEPTTPLRAVTDHPPGIPQPHDDAAEKTVLGAAMTSTRVLTEAAGRITADDFHNPHHATLWRAIEHLAARGEPTEPIAIHAHLGPTEANRVGGAPAIFTIYQTACTPSMAPWYIRRVAETARARRAITHAVRLSQAAAGDNPDKLTTEYDRLAEHIADEQQAHQLDHAGRTTWAHHPDLTDAVNGIGPDMHPALMPRSDGPCLLYPAAVHTLSGEPESGKTWIALHAATQQLTDGHPVAYIDFEDRAERVVARLLTIGAKPDDILGGLRYIRPDQPLTAAARPDLLAAVDGCPLTIIDGVTEAMTLHGLNLNDNTDIATFYALLPRPLANTGAAVLLIDHVVKDDEKQGRWGIGGQHKLAGIDGAAYTVKVVEPFGRGRRGMARVHIAKDRYGYVVETALGRTAAEFHLDATTEQATARLDPPEAMPKSAAGDPRPTVLMEKVSRWLEVHPDATGREVDDAHIGKAEYVRRALRQLITEGHVDTRPGTRGATHHRIIEPFHREGKTP